MPVRNRTQLQGVNQSQLPDNNEKLITPTRHRSVNTDLIDSKFNLIDDDSEDVSFNNTGTDLAASNVDAAIKELNNRIRPFLGGGIIRIGDLNSGNIGDTRTIVSGTFSSCEISAADGPGREYEVSMDSVGTANYIPILTFEGNGDMERDTQINPATFRDIANNSFKFFLRETDGVVQNLDVRIILISLF